jgi:hypothetical protein
VGSLVAHPCPGPRCSRHGKTQKRADAGRESQSPVLARRANAMTAMPGNVRTVTPAHDLPPQAALCSAPAAHGPARLGGPGWRGHRHRTRRRHRRDLLEMRVPVWSYRCVHSWRFRNTSSRGRRQGAPVRHWREGPRPLCRRPLRVGTAIARREYDRRLRGECKGTERRGTGCRQPQPSACHTGADAR